MQNGSQLTSMTEAAAPALHTQEREEMRWAQGRTGVASTVEMMSWYFSVDSISDTMRAGLRSVAINVVSRHTRMPQALISSGYCMAAYRWLEPSADTDEMTSAAQVDSANEPNRSAPMPAMSPTLSPTLSARAARHGALGAGLHAAEEVILPDNDLQKGAL